MTSKKLSGLEKLQAVRDEAARIEKKAFDKERTAPEDAGEYIRERSQQTRIQAEFEKVDEVNGLLLDAIKAKLAILDQQ